MEGFEDGLVLTPILATSKIPILALIIGYCYKDLPPSTVPPILSTLVQLIEHNDRRESQTELISLYFPSLKEILKLIEDAVTSFAKEMNTQTPTEVANDVKAVQKYLLNSLWSITSLDMFHDFVSGVNRLLVDYENTPKNESVDKGTQPEKLLTSSSFLGRFVYNIAIAFEVLVFDDTVELWNTFLKYREETKELWSNLNGHEVRQSHHDEPQTQWQRQVLRNSGLLDARVDGSRQQVISQIDLAQMLEQQVQIMQKYSPPPPQELETKRL
ncbi:hypothetical protein KL948_005365 [Ogataea haglerorum]|nr:hypothetical protein KL948_005365 [Ogataea haglerorum]